MIGLITHAKMAIWLRRSSISPSFATEGAKRRLDDPAFPQVGPVSGPATIIHGLEESNGIRALVMELVEGDDSAPPGYYTLYDVGHGPAQPLQRAGGPRP
jgi:hypothetical protein